METEIALDGFRDKMYVVLAKHQEKKGDSWNTCDIQYLEDKLLEEIDEYKNERKPLAKAEELIDIANMCMMLHHRYMDIWGEKAANFIFGKRDGGT